MAGDGGEVKIADFGMAKLADDVVSGLTAAGTVVGTPHYMSPEQCLGEPVDGRADIYSLGATYFRLLTGSAPFADNNPLAVARMQVCEPHPDPRSIDPAVRRYASESSTRPWPRIGLGAYQTAAEMAEALESAESCLRQADDMRAAAERGAADGPGLAESDLMDALRSSGELVHCRPPGRPARNRGWPSRRRFLRPRRRTASGGRRPPSTTSSCSATPSCWRPCRRRPDCGNRRRRNSANPRPR